MHSLGRLPRDTRLFMAARAARSLGQGALIVGFSLYLKALGWSAPAIGALFTGGLLVDAALAVTVGPFSDRLGRKRFLMAYEVAQAAAAMMALATRWSALLAVAAIVGGFGRGANGSSGPFSPVELSWLAQTLSSQSRGGVYSANMAIGFSGMGGGALLGASPAFFAHYVSGALAYRPLFLISLAGRWPAFFCSHVGWTGRRPHQRAWPGRPATKPAGKMPCYCGCWASTH